MFMSVSIFILIKQINIQRNGLKNIVNFISTYSFGTYLSHVLVLSLLKEVGITGSWVHPLWGIPITTFIALIFSITLVYGIKKLPLGNYISG